MRPLDNAEQRFQDFLRGLVNFGGQRSSRTPAQQGEEGGKRSKVCRKEVKWPL